MKFSLAAPLLAVLAAASCRATIIDPITSGGAGGDGGGGSSSSCPTMDAVAGAPVGPAGLCLVCAPSALEHRPGEHTLGPFRPVRSGADTAAIVSSGLRETQVSLATCPPALGDARQLHAGGGSVDVVDNGDFSYALVAQTNVEGTKFLFADRVEPSQAPTFAAWTTTAGPRVGLPHAARVGATTMLTYLASNPAGPLNDLTPASYVAREHAGIVDAPDEPVACTSARLDFSTTTAAVGLADRGLFAVFGAGTSCAKSATNDSATLSLVTMPADGDATPTVASFLELPRHAYAAYLRSRPSGAWLVTFDADGIDVRAVSGDGATVGAPIHLETTVQSGGPGDAFDAVATPDGGLLLAWIHDVDGTYTTPINVARLDAAGAIVAWGSTLSDYDTHDFRPISIVAHDGAYTIFIGRADPDSGESDEPLPTLLHAFTISDAP